MAEARMFKVGNELANLSRHIRYYDTNNPAVKPTDDPPSGDVVHLDEGDARVSKSAHDRQNVVVAQAAFHPVGR